MVRYFHSEVVSIGDGANEMIDGGVVIFFAEPCPAELADVSIVHRVINADPQRNPEAGDMLRVGDSRLAITAVGALAGDNLRSLGHLVVYRNPDLSQSLLPGAVQAVGDLTVPPVGAVIELIAGA